VNSELVRQVYDFGAADKMRQLETRGEVDGMRQFGKDPNALKVRKARVGSFREELSEADIDFCNEYLSRLPPEWRYASD
jgi:hypothetical protein